MTAGNRHINETAKLNETAWNLAAQKYASEIEHDVAMLRAGEVSLLAMEREALGDLSWCGRAIHLQCSHGLDALSLWKLGARAVIGVDISQAMLAQATEKSQLLDAPATWIHSDVLAVPEELNATADLVYTGKGALPWVMDLSAWAAVVVRLLKPGGRFYLFEGHPLNWIWDVEGHALQLQKDGRGYFDEETRANRSFPASAIARFAPPGAPAPEAIERNWTLGAILTALAGAGLILEQFQEYPEQFWPQFENTPEALLARIPHSFSLLMRKASR